MGEVLSSVIKFDFMRRSGEPPCSNKICAISYRPGPFFTGNVMINELIIYLTWMFRLFSLLKMRGKC